jgi:hypothetical protein
MKRILLDQNVPIGVRGILAEFEVTTARYIGWEKLLNGELIAKADSAGFDILITADRKLVYQQNLSGRRIALIVLGVNDWPIVRAGSAQLVAVVKEAGAGSFTELLFRAPDTPKEPLPPKL